MTEEQGYIASALEGLLASKMYGSGTWNDDQIRFYSTQAVKLGKATMYAHTTELKPDIPTEVIVEEKVIVEEEVIINK